MRNVRVPWLRGKYVARNRALTSFEVWTDEVVAA
jgi:hypothetical protein